MVKQSILMRLVNIEKHFGNTQIFENFFLDIPNGSSVLIQGPSGCGKTTLLRCMALLESIQEGSIEFGGETVLFPNMKPNPPRKVRLEISMVFQNLYLWNHLTVFENVALPLLLLGDNGEQFVGEKANHMLSILGLKGKEKEYPINLSGGQQQRVALARALVHSPKLLLLDEITANLDEETGKKVLQAVEIVWKKGTTVVIASHSPKIPNSLKKILLKYEFGRWKSSN
jgi:ABC-type polar amino acid transport system ATPase subunit